MKLSREEITDTIQSKNAYKVVIPLFCILLAIGIVAPSFTETLYFKDDADTRILANLLTGFIAVPSTVLAIAAVLFAILQIANRKITFVQLIFENSGIIPVIYWATINSLILILLQLFSDSMDSFWLLRILTCLTYNMAILLIGLFYTLYRTFRYLDYTNITDDYIENISRLIRKELIPASKDLDHQQLRQRSKEVYAEMTDAVSKDDAVLINKFLKSFAYALLINPSSNYITDFNSNLAAWTVKALRLQSKLFGPMIEFWRTQFAYKFSGKLDYRFDNIDRLPLLAYKLAETETSLRITVIEVFSIRLKEMAQKQCFLAKERQVLRLESNFDKLFPIFLEYSELMRYLIDASDLPALKIVLNDIKTMRESFIDGNFRATRTKVIISRSRSISKSADMNQGDLARYHVVLKIVREIDMIVIGNMSWIYFRLLRGKVTLLEQPSLKATLQLFHEYLRSEEIIEAVTYLYNHEDNRMLWDDWIWRDEERLSGRAYAVASINDLLSAGFSGVLIRQQFNLGRHSVNALEDMRFLLERAKGYLARMRREPGEWPEIFELSNDNFLSRIDQVYQMLDGLESNIEDEHTAELAMTSVSMVKVAAFKELMQQQWDESRDLSRVFEHFAAVEINPEDRLIDGGDNISLAKGKVMFIDGPLFNVIHGMQFGKRVNDAIAYQLAEIVEAKAEANSDDTLAEVFERGITALSLADYEANAILIDSALFYTHEISLSITGKYTSINNHQNPYDFSIAGFYNNLIPIIPVESYRFHGLVVIAQMPNGLVMQQGQSDEYYKQRLILEVRSIDEACAHRIQQERQSAGNREPLSVTELMASMEIHVHQIYNFKIVDSRAVKVYHSHIDAVKG